MNDYRTKFSEEALLAFADGDLRGEDARAIEAALSQDQTLRETVRLLRLGSSAVARAFNQPLSEPVPQRLLTVARGAGSRAGEHSRGPLAKSWVLGLAASLAAFAIGLGGGYLVRPSPHSYTPASEAASDPLTARFEMTLLGALDTGAEGQLFSYASKDAGEGVIVLGRSFTTASGSRCREFRRQETRGKQQQSDGGIACRGANRAWSMMILAGSS
jgi:hypothetical protein